MKVNHPLVILDLETTGTWLEKDKIIEIGLIKLSPDSPKETQVLRVNPGIPIPAIITKLIGISDSDVKDAPYFRAIAETVYHFIGEADLAGFNVERFDLPLLEREFFEIGIKFEWRHRTIYDAQKVYHVHEKRDLTAAYKFYCGKDLENAHSALADSEATLEILAAQIEKYGKGDISIESLKEFEYLVHAEYFGREKKFRWWNGEVYPLFGKYARKKSLREIAAKHPDYLKWILSADFSDEIKTTAENALCGKFPSLQAAPLPVPS